MTTRTASARVPLEAMHGIIETAMDGLDLAHSCEWIRPDSCPCHVLGRSCLLPLPEEEGRCQGYAAEILTPPEHTVTTCMLVSALPEPDKDGTVDTVTAALSLIQVIESRLLPPPYTLRAHALREALIEASEEYELAHSAVSAPPPSPGYQLRCQRCGNVIPAARGPRARYCKNGCRVMAARARKREAEKVNATASGGR